MYINIKFLHAIAIFHSDLEFFFYYSIFCVSNNATIHVGNPILSVDENVTERS